MSEYRNMAGVKVPEVLLPRAGTDMTKWAVVACDQFTSQPEYWEETERIVGDAPSTLRLMLPEMYLEKPNEAARIAAINEMMKRYLASGVLENRGKGFVFVRRTVGGRSRCGLIVALDLECYDYSRGSTTLIRATEGTIVERIPPRLRIRKDAPLELPHILVLIDDPARTVIEPVGESLCPGCKAYDFELMQGGGHVEGWFVGDEARINSVLRALEKLADPAKFHEKYGCDQPPLLFAMGDGNHSLATAKANWENLKANLDPAAREDHPARYALVELENVHDEGIAFEPIHRVLFNLDVNKALCWLENKLAADNGGCETALFASKDECDAKAAAAARDGAHVLPFVTSEGFGFFRVEKPAAQLGVGTLQSALDAMRKDMKDAAIDYIHGAEVVLELGAKPGNMGFLLPPMEKSALFRTVIFDGALPRKTFSMGEANEKRYYLECRKISR
jgi:hypothetical protein